MYIITYNSRGPDIYEIYRPNEESKEMAQFHWESMMYLECVRCSYILSEIIPISLYNINLILSQQIFIYIINNPCYKRVLGLKEIKSWENKDCRVLIGLVLYGNFYVLQNWVPLKVLKNAFILPHEES